MRGLWKPLKKIPSLLEEHIKHSDIEYARWNVFMEDECRIGLFTRNGKALTARGVKPISPYYHKYESTYLFGAFSPVNGASLILELPKCNTDNFELFLKHLSLLDEEEYKIIFLDNGAFHKAKRLIIPHNICLVFLPPYSPELNPAEKVWWTIKRELNNKAFKTMEQLQDEVDTIIKKLINVETIKSLTGYEIYLKPIRSILNF
jgi:transposase